MFNEISYLIDYICFDDKNLRQMNEFTMSFLLIRKCFFRFVMLLLINSHIFIERKVKKKSPSGLSFRSETIKTIAYILIDNSDVRLYLK